MVDGNNFYDTQQNHMERDDISHFEESSLSKNAKKRENKEKEKQLEAYPQATQLDTHKNTIAEIPFSDLKSGQNSSAFQRGSRDEAGKVNRTDQMLDEICQKRGSKRAKQRVFLSKISSHDNKASEGPTLTKLDQEEDQ